MIVICQYSVNDPDIYFLVYHDKYNEIDDPRALWCHGKVIEKDGILINENTSVDLIPRFCRRNAIQIAKKYFPNDKIVEVVRTPDFSYIKKKIT